MRSEEEKVRIWKEFLLPRFKRAFCLERNRINQRMKKYFNSKFIDLCVLFTLHAACYTNSTFIEHTQAIMEAQLITPAVRLRIWSPGV